MDRVVISVKGNWFHLRFYDGFIRAISLEEAMQLRNDLSVEIAKAGRDTASNETK